MPKSMCKKIKNKKIKKQQQQQQQQKGEKGKNEENLKAKLTFFFNLDGAQDEGRRLKTKIVTS